MGAEQSTNKEKDRISKNKDIQEALEKQRIQYENKMQELLRTHLGNNGNLAQSAAPVLENLQNNQEDKILYPILQNITKDGLDNTVLLKKEGSTLTRGVSDNASISGSGNAAINLNLLNKNNQQENPTTTRDVYPPIPGQYGYGHVPSNPYQQKNSTTTRDLYPHIPGQKEHGHVPTNPGHQQENLTGNRSVPYNQSSLGQYEYANAASSDLINRNAQSVNFSTGGLPHLQPIPGQYGYNHVAPNMNPYFTSQHHHYSASTGNMPFQAPISQQYGNYGHSNAYKKTNNNQPQPSGSGSTKASAPELPVEKLTARTRSKDVNVNMHCPTCGNTARTKVFQCSNGHSFCDKCRSRGAFCGVCPMPLSERNNFTEMVKCPNADDGCCLSFKLTDMDRHLKECPFKELRCPEPFNKCKWIGKLSHLSIHFDEFHPKHRQGNVDTELCLPNIVNNSRTMHFVVLGPYNFLFHIIVSETKRSIFMLSQLIGTEVSANKWRYEIHVYNKGEPRKKYLYTDRCASASVPVDDLVKKTKCAELPLTYAMSFINEGVLTYKFFLKRELGKKGIKKASGIEQSNDQNEGRIYKNRRNYKKNNNSKEDKKNEGNDSNDVTDNENENKEKKENKKYNNNRRGRGGYSGRGGRPQQSRDVQQPQQ